METESTPKQPKAIEYRPPEGGLPRVYANNVQMGTTSFDMKIIFGEVVEVQPDKVIVEQNVQVTMSWPEAKIIADFIQANVKIHEDLNGPLKLPKNAPAIIVPATFPVEK